MTELQRQIDAFLAARGSLSPKTIENYGYIFDAFAGYAGDTWPPTGELLAGFLAHLRKRGLKPSTIRTYYNNLRTFTGWLLVTDRIDRDPWRGVKPAPLPKLLPKAPSDDALDILISHLERRVEKALSREIIETDAGLSMAQLAIRDLAIYSFMLDTGLRVGEVEQLYVSEVNLAECTAFVRQSKTGAQRTVRFCKAVRGNLRLWLTVRGQLRPIVTIPNLFVNRMDDQWNPQSHWAIRQTLKRLCKKLGLKSISPHQLRHAYATVSIRNQAPLVHVQRMLGHAGVQMTLRYSMAVGLDRAAEIHAETSPMSRRAAS